MYVAYGHCRALKEDKKQNDQEKVMQTKILQAKEKSQHKYEIVQPV